MVDYPSEPTKVNYWPAPLYCLHPGRWIPNSGPKDRTDLQYRILDGGTCVFTIPTDPPAEVVARKTTISVDIEGRKVCVEVVQFPPFALSGLRPYPLPLPTVPLEDWVRKVYYVSKANGDAEPFPVHQPF